MSEASWSVAQIILNTDLPTAQLREFLELHRDVKYLDAALQRYWTDEGLQWLWGVLRQAQIDLDEKINGPIQAK